MRCHQVSFFGCPCCCFPRKCLLFAVSSPPFPGNVGVQKERINKKPLALSVVFNESLVISQTQGRTSLTLQPLLFWKKHDKPQQKQGFFSSQNPWNPWTIWEGKTHKKNKENRKKKQIEESQGLEGQEFSNLKNLLMPFFLTGCFPEDF